jgi:hypothetical protein
MTPFVQDTSLHMSTNSATLKESELFLLFTRSSIICFTQPRDIETPPSMPMAAPTPTNRRLRIQPPTGTIPKGCARRVSPPKGRLVEPEAFSGAVQKHARACFWTAPLKASGSTKRLFNSLLICIVFILLVDL